MVAGTEDKGSRTDANSGAGGPTRHGTSRWVYALLVAFMAMAALATYRMVDTSGQLTAIERERLSLLQEKGRLDNALASARKQVDELKSVQSTSEAVIKSSREDAKAASTQSVQFQERAKALEAELATVRQELTGTAKSKGDFEARAVGLERDMGGLKGQVGELQQRLGDTQAKLQAALEAKQKAEALAQQQQQQLQQLQQQLQQTRPVPTPGQQ